MAKVTLAGLERHLVEAMEILRGRSSQETANHSLPHVLALLLMKRAHDAEAGALAVPPAACWNRLRLATHAIEERLDSAWAAFALANTSLAPIAEHLDFRRLLRLHRLAERDDAELCRRLVRHFDVLSLSDADLLTSHVLGRAADALIERVETNRGKKGGQVFTPRTLTRLMAGLAQPRPGERIYDPCAGTGGMLLAAQDHVRDHAGGTPVPLHLAGQDLSVYAFTVATLNLALHGAHQGVDLALGNTLTEPGHRPEHETERFDVVLGAPPFAMDYASDSIPALASRMPYGLASGLRKADLMFVQHMLWAAKRTCGRVVALVPHGVLFRGGGERHVRASLLNPDFDAIEAVIGLAPNLLLGTGIPAALLVLRAPGTKPPERRGKVLFVNADRAYDQGRALNVLRARDVCSIVRAFHAYVEEQGFSRVVSREEIAAAGDSLNVRHYVDSAPGPEPQDVRAHMEGGIPRAEIEARGGLLASYGLAVSDLFAVRTHGDPAYFAFLPKRERLDMEQLTALARPVEKAFQQSFDTWWSDQAAPHLVGLAEMPPEEALSDFRAALFTSFLEQAAAGPLNRGELSAAFDEWWHAIRDDLTVLAESGWGALLDGWLADVATILSPSPSGEGQTRPVKPPAAYSHEVVEALAPGFFARWHAARLRLDGARSAVEEAQAAGAVSRLKVDADGAPDECDPATEAVLAEVRAERRTAFRDLKKVQAGFDLEAARRSLDESGERHTVLSVLRSRLASTTEILCLRRRRELISTYVRWEAKYGLSFREIEAQLGDRKDSAAASLSRQNPWSRQDDQHIASDLVTDPKRRKVRQRLHRVIDVEKAIEASVVKLEVDLWLGFSPSDGGVRLSLRDIVLTAQPGVVGSLGTDDLGQPVVRPANLTGSGVDLTDLRYVAQHTTPVLSPGDVLVPQTVPPLPVPPGNSNWQAVVWQDQLPHATFSLGLMRIVPDTQQVLATYLAEWLSQPTAQERLRVIASDEMDPRMLGRRLLDLEIDLPSLPEQRRIVDASAVTKRRATRRREELTKLRLIQETLRKDLETGSSNVTHFD
ncbi:N-6 DNA methylase [Streptomyces kronopolitis]|uniref:N-6 DNA methylase n=1 Tax=Streptomyces kronopolitis TaxID=1612435 RepID=UPI00369FEE5D